MATLSSSGAILASTGASSYAPPAEGTSGQSQYTHGPLTLAAVVIHDVASATSGTLRRTRSQSLQNRAAGTLSPQTSLAASQKTRHVHICLAVKVAGIRVRASWDLCDAPGAKVSKTGPAVHCHPQRPPWPRSRRRSCHRPRWRLGRSCPLRHRCTLRRQRRGPPCCCLPHEASHQPFVQSSPHRSQRA